MENGFHENERAMDLNHLNLDERSYEDPHIRAVNYTFQNLYRGRERSEMRVSNPTIQRYRDIAAEVYRLFIIFSSRNNWLSVLHEVLRNAETLQRLEEILRDIEESSTTLNHENERQSSSTSMNDVD